MEDYKIILLAIMFVSSIPAIYQIDATKSLGYKDWKWMFLALLLTWVVLGIWILTGLPGIRK